MFASLPHNSLRLRSTLQRVPPGGRDAHAVPADGSPGARPGRDHAPLSESTSSHAMPKNAHAAKLQSHHDSPGALPGVGLAPPSRSIPEGGGVPCRGARRRHTHLHCVLAQVCPAPVPDGKVSGSGQCQGRACRVSGAAGLCWAAINSFASLARE
jgi:hypothetical protein